MNYRPDGFDKLKDEFFGKSAIHTTHEDFLFEAGADAYAEALKEGGGFRCSIIGVQGIAGGSTIDPLRFNIQTQAIVEDFEGYTNMSLPHFNQIEYPYKKGWL
ncbi:unnamed protein product, partial [marine sediment metagenome]